MISRGLLLAALVVLGNLASFSQASDDPAEFRTVETAITTRISKAGPSAVLQPGFLGVLVTAAKEGLTVSQVQADSPASRAGLLAGDLVAKVAGEVLRSADHLKEILGARNPGDALKVEVVRQQKTLELTAQLSSASRPLAPAGTPATGKGGFDTRKLGPWRKDVYRLAVVGIEYADVKHNEKITIKDWEESLFSRNTYINKKSATGQPVHGSMNDYYHELSYGTFRPEGKVFPFIEVGKKRSEYGDGANKTALLTEALDKLLARDGKDALKGFDGIWFLYAGGRVQTVRGSLYWPHRSSVSFQGKRWPYFICQEGGAQMGNISVICHEFGHMLGLPDLYARPENPGSEGVGVWCAMSNQAGGGRPQHFSAWSKEQLGWLQPALIDPATPQKLVLSPIYKSPKECFKILVRADGSEYLLLENRAHNGFDKSLPAEGLLIWRVVRGRPVLEESHGVAGPAGPRLFPAAVPYPSPSNDAFTPFTMPSSRPQLNGGVPVHITNIRRLPDGRVTFFVGYEFF